MPQIFAFVIGQRDKHAQRNLEKSVENPIDERIVFSSFPSAQREELERIQEEGN